MTAMDAEARTGKCHTKNGLRILIAEDYEDGAESTAILLRLSGHQVIIARNGRDALEMAWADKPDVVLLDIDLPLLSGYDVAKRLSGPRPNKTPLLIAVTGWGREEDRLRSREAGIDLHLVKPVDPVYLQTILNRFQTLIGGAPVSCERIERSWVTFTTAMECTTAHSLLRK